MRYNANVHKTFYASGFLYHPESAQILLQQTKSSDDEPSWALLEIKGQGQETKGENFRRLVRTLLKLNLSFGQIHLIYDYYHAGLGKKYYVSYAEVDKLRNFPPAGKTVFAWFTQKEILKLHTSKLTKQDIIVGQRVINATVRKKAGEQTAE